MSNGRRELYERTKMKLLGSIWSSRVDPSCFLHGVSCGFLQAFMRVLGIMPLIDLEVDRLCYISINLPHQSCILFSWGTLLKTRDSN